MRSQKIQVFCVGSGFEANRIAKVRRESALSTKQAFRLSASNSNFSREFDAPASPESWNRVLQRLQQNQVQCISSEELLIAKDSGVPIIDVRPQKDYEAGFIEGSVNIPLYDLVKGWSAQQIVKRMGYAAFGVLNGTELNGDFFDEVEQLVEKGDGAVMVCGQGGRLTRDSPRSAVLPTRSLIAAHELVYNGYKNVRVLSSGTKGWEEEGRDMLMMIDE